MWRTVLTLHFIINNSADNVPSVAPYAPSSAYGATEDRSRTSPHRQNLVMERPGFSSISDGRVSLFGPNSCLGESKRVHNRRQVNSDDNDDFDQTILI